jgi:hypothetical protein
MFVYAAGLLQGELSRLNIAEIVELVCPEHNQDYIGKGVVVLNVFSLEAVVHSKLLMPVIHRTDEFITVKPSVNVSMHGRSLIVNSFD